MKHRSPEIHVWRWTRRIAATDEEAWRERLVRLGPGNIVVHGRPGLKTVCTEAYAQTPAVVRKIAREFGGRLEKLDLRKIATSASTPRKPLRLAADFAVMDAYGCWPGTVSKPRTLLRIGGAMAFGTGEHATTASCLRILRHEAKHLGRGWTALDIGTGTGILAIAAEKFGASRVDAIDNDPRAVRAARANVLLNRCKLVTARRADLFKWNTRRAYSVVVANVFSEILRENAQRIVNAVQPAGCLVLSGILRIQEEETGASFVAKGLCIEQTRRRGKWSTIVLRRITASAQTKHAVS